MCKVVITIHIYISFHAIKATTTTTTTTSKQVIFIMASIAPSSLNDNSKKSKGRLLYVGVQLHCPINLTKEFEASMKLGFSFILAPLVHPRGSRSKKMVEDRQSAFTRSDLVLNTDDWSTCIVGKISDWICYSIDSSSSIERTNAEFALAQEFQWSQHIGIPAVQIMCPTTLSKYDNFSRCLNQLLNEYRGLHVWLTVPLEGPSNDQIKKMDKDREFHDDLNDDEEEKNSSDDNAWSIWNRVRSLCSFIPSLSVCLFIGKSVPSNPLLLKRWFGEPVKAALIHVDAFLPNEQGYPVLPKLHQIYIKELLQHNVQFILTGRAKHKLGILPYLQYLRYLKDQMPPETFQEINERPYYDYLQEPLQPLFHNLESATYNVFEQCPVKYREYEEAISRCFQYKLSSYATTNTVNDPLTLMVVGAGRGPLVTCALNAAKISGITNLNIVAVEKNPNAVVTLRAKFAKHSNVKVIASDMRLYKPEHKADILVSELLGSFGDNELSPECLDGAQKFLKKPDGISIPCDSTSFLSPITTNKLWNEGNKYKDNGKHLEIPYVVRLHDFFEIADAKKCFTFVHPNWDNEVIDNRRFKKLVFKATVNTICHGFAGYFESTLFEDVFISINPKSFSTGMFSWFPMYFPLHTPFLVKENEMIEVNFWRCVKDRKVWYEWCVVQPCVSPIHNVNGRSSWIGL